MADVPAICQRPQHRWVDRMDHQTAEPWRQFWRLAPASVTVEWIFRPSQPEPLPSRPPATPTGSGIRSIRSKLPADGNAVLVHQSSERPWRADFHPREDDSAEHVPRLQMLWQYARCYARLVLVWCGSNGVECIRSPQNRHPHTRDFALIVRSVCSLG